MTVIIALTTLCLVDAGSWCLEVGFFECSPEVSRWQHRHGNQQRDWGGGKISGRWEGSSLTISQVRGLISCSGELTAALIPILWPPFA